MLVVAKRCTHRKERMQNLVCRPYACCDCLCSVYTASLSYAANVVNYIPETNIPEAHTSLSGKRCVFSLDYAIKTGVWVQPICSELMLRASYISCGTCLSPVRSCSLGPFVSCMQRNWCLCCRAGGARVWPSVGGGQCAEGVGQVDRVALC